MGTSTHHRTTSAPRVPLAVRWCWRVLAWMLILGFLAALTAGVLVPRLAGATPYTVLTGSMKPQYPPGTLVVVREVDPREIGIGTVITYQLRSGEPQVVTHRVVETGSNLDGEQSFVTRGDANTAVDPERVRPEQVRGALWYAVPYLGHASLLFDGDQRQQGIYLVAVGLGGYALVMFVGALRERRRGASDHDQHRDQDEEETCGV